MAAGTKGSQYFRGCGSDGWFFEARDDVALLSGMSALFQKALGSANRLTH